MKKGILRQMTRGWVVFEKKETLADGIVTATSYTDIDNDDFLNLPNILTHLKWNAVAGGYDCLFNTLTKYYIDGKWQESDTLSNTCGFGNSHRTYAKIVLADSSANDTYEWDNFFKAADPWGTITQDKKECLIKNFYPPTEKPQ